MSDPTLDVIHQQDEEIAATEQAIALASARLGVLRETLDDLITQRDTLVQIAVRRGSNPADLLPPRSAGPAESESDWLSLSRVDAIERVLRESPGPMHLTEIETGLRMHGRMNDGPEVISSTLTHIRKTRRTIASLGQGRWEYVRAGTNASGHPPYPVQLGVSEDMAQILSGGRHPESDFGPDPSGVHGPY